MHPSPRALDRPLRCTALPGSPSRERRVTSPLPSHSAVGGTPQSRRGAPCSPARHTGHAVSLRDLEAVPGSLSSPRSLKGHFGPSVLPPGAQTPVTGESSQCDEGSGVGGAGRSPFGGGQGNETRGARGGHTRPSSPPGQRFGRQRQVRAGPQEGKKTRGQAPAAPWPPGGVPESERCFLSA